jgi:hypothetical protein
MKTKDISQARDKDLRSSMAALLRAAASAREIAIQTGTAIVIHKEANAMGSRLNILHFIPLRLGLPRPPRPHRQAAMRWNPTSPRPIRVCS